MPMNDKDHNQNDGRSSGESGDSGKVMHSCVSPEPLSWEAAGEGGRAEVTVKASG